ncbi:hydroxymethylglutaryl-CoA lyase [Salsipaludibacter albus]|uniref:hydroxymethylglutaryl-CoA lyase n=1 Tax=Salsipaludibacter albus TaxID=2849650 RepID=UPI001EE3D7DD|nr:hydroxymethylglutaryl-CoA lyase [Salsipaludibacter albus]MBY5161865.1 hydroxymethylglutaryl-CoA lyase [Salsipaludibacter albus]
MDTIEIVEVGPRDGLQNEDVVLDPPTRVDFVGRLVAAGIRRLETVSFVHPGRVPQMAGAEEVMAGVVRRADDGSPVSHIGLVLNERGLERAIAAEVDEVNLVVITTEEFSRRNQGAGVADVVAATRRMMARAHDVGLRTTVTVSAAFGCPFAGEVSTDDVLAVVDPVLEGDPDELALADTIGVGVPADVRRLVDAVRSRTDIALRAHFHNTRNTGYANAIAAAESGVAALDASSGGFGGCPFAPAATGNIATEDLVYGLARSGFDTGLDVDALTVPAAWITARLGEEQPPALLGRAGTFPG